MFEDRSFADEEYSYDANPYYNPEKCQLEIIAEASKDPDYDFNMIIVWRDVVSDEIFWARDSGCSCPVPFEDYHKLSDFEHLTMKNIDDFKKEILEGEGYEYRSIPLADRQDLVMEAIKAIPRHDPVSDSIETDGVEFLL